MGRGRKAGCGCLTVLVLVSVAIAWPWCRHPSAHMEPLPPGEASGTLVLRPVPAAQPCLVSIDLGNLSVAPLSPDIWLCSPDGEWAILREVRGGRETFRAVGKEGGVDLPLQSTRPPEYSRLNGGAALGGAVFGFPKLVRSLGNAPRFVVVDVLQGTVRSMPWAGSDMVHYCGNAGRVCYQTPAGAIWRAQLGGVQSEFIGNGWAPALSRGGDLAYLTSDRRSIVIVGSRTPAHLLLRGPGARVQQLQWSPDAKWLVYQYSVGLLGMQSRTGDVWGVGMVQLASGRHYRVLPGAFGSGEIRFSARSGQLQWVSRLPTALRGAVH